MGGISVIFLMGIFSVWAFIFIAIFATIVIFAVINYIFESISISCIGNKMNCSFKFITWKNRRKQNNWWNTWNIKFVYSAFWNILFCKYKN